MDLYHLITTSRKPFVIFTVLGKYKPEYNYKLALKGFSDFIARKGIYMRSSLVIIFTGTYNPNEQQQKYCWEEITHTSEYTMHTEQIVLFPELDPKLKRDLLSRSFICLYLKDDNEFNPDVITAMEFGTPVIGFNSGFTKEVIRHGISGYLIPPDSKYIGLIFANLTSNFKLYKDLSASTRIYFSENLTTHLHLTRQEVEPECEEIKVLYVASNVHKIASLKSLCAAMAAAKVEDDTEINDN